MRTSRFLFVLAAAGMLAACTKPAGDATKTAEAPKAAAEAAKSAVAATVNGKQITQEMLDTFSQAVMGNSPEPATDEQKTQLLDQLINMTLAAQAAEKDGLQKDPKVAGRLDLLRTQILAEAASEKFVKAQPVTDADLKAEYDTQVAGMPKEYKARHILVDAEGNRRVDHSRAAGRRRLLEDRRQGVEGLQRQGGRRPWLVLPADDGQAVRRRRAGAREGQVHDHAGAERVRLARHHPR